MNIKLAAVCGALLFAFAACGGGQKQTSTEAPKEPVTSDKVAPTPAPEPAPAPTPVAKGEPTCEAAVVHVIDLVIKAGMMPAEKKAETVPKAIEKCKQENPPKEVLQCILSAASFAEVSKCDPKKGQPDTKTPPPPVKTDSKSQP